MIRSTSLSAIIAMAQNLIETKYIIIPKPQTPLSEAVAKCYSPSMHTNCGQSPLTSADAINTLQDLCWMMRNPDNNIVTANDSCHGDVCDQFAKLLADSVRDTISTSRTIVTPLVNQIVDYIQQCRKNNETNIANTLTIVVDRFESIWDSETLHDLVGRFNDAPAYGDVELFNVHPALTVEQIVAMLKTGVARADKDIEEWLDFVGTDYVVRTYQSYFVPSMDRETTKRLDPSDYGYNIHWLDGRGIAARNEYLAVHLFARTLLQNPPEGLDMSLEQYREMMAGVLEQTGRMICRLFEHRRFDREQKRLVLNWPAENAEFMAQYPDLGHLFVNGDIYDEWLAEGGTPEALLGSAVTDRSMNYSWLIENKDQYERDYASRTAVVRSGQSSREYGVVLSALRDSITKAINELPEDRLVDGTRSNLHIKLDGYLQETYMQDVSEKNIYRTVRKIVCGVMFQNRDIRTVLDNIDTLREEHGDMEIREIALLSTIDLLTRWFSTLVDIKIGDVYCTHEGSVITGLTLANIVQLTEDVIVHVAGDDISNKLNGNDIYTSTVADVVAASLQAKLVPKTLL